METLPQPDLAGGDTTHTRRRRICSRCDRPERVCLCATIPAEPISPTRTRIVILHHPHEQRHKLATVPVLAKCVPSCEIILGRKLRYGDSNVLDSLYDSATGEGHNPPVTVAAAFLFPGTVALPSTDISLWKSSVMNAVVKEYVLIVFDGTWKHAKEMVLASYQFLSKFAAQVFLSYDVRVDGGTIFDSDLILRKEPFGGCISTMEAVARCLRVLEPNGPEMESRLVEVLRAMVRFQASFLMSANPQAQVREVKGY